MSSFIAVSAAAALAMSAQVTEAPASGAAAAPASARTLVVQVCQGCHGPEILSRRGRTKDEWTTVVQTMIDRGATASDQDFQTITDYLALTYPPAPATAAK